MRLLYIKSGKVKLSFVSNLNYIFLLLFAKLDKGEHHRRNALSLLLASERISDPK